MRVGKTHVPISYVKVDKIHAQNNSYNSDNIVKTNKTHTNNEWRDLKELIDNTNLKC